MKAIAIFLLTLILHTAVEGQEINRWFLAMKKNDGATPFEALYNYTPIFAPGGKFYADPMLFKHNGVNYLFFEDYDYKKGVISFVAIDEDLEISTPTKVLELDTHLSFPFIFEDEGHIYMLPESCTSREVTLYEAEDFPYNWVKKQTLLPLAGIDSVLFKHNGYYWIFTTADVPEQPTEIYYSTSLFSEFHPHPMNERHLPGRNAGHFFIDQGRLIRPVMNSEISYGHHIVFKEILTLTPTQFEEREIFTLNPDWAPRLKGMHTFNFNEDLVVYDAKVVSEPFPRKGEEIHSFWRIHNEREWMDDNYFPRLEGRVLFVGLAPYNMEHYKQVKNPESFETIDFDPRNVPYGSPYGHHLADFLTFDPGYLYDHISLYGVLGREDSPPTGEKFNISSQKKISLALEKAHRLLKPNGTLLLGPDLISTKPGTKNLPHLNVNFWHDRFERAPLDQYEPIFLGFGDQNFVWWGRKK